MDSLLLLCIVYRIVFLYCQALTKQVKDAISAVINVDDYGASARLLAATTLRNVLGTKNLGDILSDREAIANDMQVSIRSFSIRCLITDDP